jgi:hypothetical protein
MHMLQVGRVGSGLGVKAIPRSFAAGDHNIWVKSVRDRQNAFVGNLFNFAVDASPAERLLIGKGVRLRHFPNIECRQITVKQKPEQGLAPACIHLFSDGCKVAVVTSVGVANDEGKIAPRVRTGGNDPENRPLTFLLLPAPFAPLQSEHHLADDTMAFDELVRTGDLG